MMAADKFTRHFVFLTDVLEFRIEENVGNKFLLWRIIFHVANTSSNHTAEIHRSSPNFSAEMQEICHKYINDSSPPFSTVDARGHRQW